MKNVPSLNQPVSLYGAHCQADTTLSIPIGVFIGLGLIIR
jgi:hypothetical protein